MIAPVPHSGTVDSSPVRVTPPTRSSRGGVAKCWVGMARFNSTLPKAQCAAKRSTLKNAFCRSPNKLCFEGVDSAYPSLACHLTRTFNYTRPCRCLINMGMILLNSQNFKAIFGLVNNGLEFGEL